MAVDEALLDSVESGASPPVLRLYRWNPAAISIGYGQRNYSDFNLEACRRLGIDIVRRITGGRSVFHDREVTYAVVSPVSGSFAGGVLESYRAISSALRAALEILGLEPKLAPRRERKRAGVGTTTASQSAVCFSAPSQFELIIDGRKVAGSAQKRSGGSFLQHGSLPTEMDLDLLSNLFPTARQMKSVEFTEDSPIGWLNRGRHEPILLDELEEAIIKGFEAVAPIRWREGGLFPPEQKAVDRLVNKYRDPGWNQRGRWVRDSGENEVKGPAGKWR